MEKAVEIAGDIVAAGAAVSGLILVYIGGLSASFATFQPQEKKSVRDSFLRRAWFAFVGLVLFLLAVTLALFGKWLSIPCMVVASLILLIVAFVWVLATAVLTVLEIK